MRGVFLFTLITALGCTPQSTRAEAPTATGGVDSGGGNAVVCRDTNRKIISAEVLDLYEGRVVFGLRPVTSNVNEALDRLRTGRDDFFNQMITGWTDWVTNKKTILPVGTGLTKIEDSFHVVKPRDCEIEQLAFFNEQAQILIDGEIWAALDATNQAAIVLHESLYKVARQYGAENSRRVRQAVAHAFAGVAVVNIGDGLPQEHILCFAPSPNGTGFPPTLFRAYNDSSGELIFQFDSLDGEIMLTKTLAHFGKLPKEKLLYKWHEGGWQMTYGSGYKSAFEPWQDIVFDVTPDPAQNGDNKTMKIGYGTLSTAKPRLIACAYERP